MHIIFARYSFQAFREEIIVVFRHCNTYGALAVLTVTQHDVISILSCCGNNGSLIIRIILFLFFRRSIIIIHYFNIVYLNRGPVRMYSIRAGAWAPQ